MYRNVSLFEQVAGIRVCNAVETFIKIAFIKPFQYIIPYIYISLLIPFGFPKEQVKTSLSSNHL